MPTVWSILLTMILFLSSFSTFADSSLVVFDGTTEGQGEGFALPRGISKLTISYQNPYKNKMHLDFDAKLKGGWAGCGWNWKSWQGRGTDISKYKSIAFYINLRPSKISDITFQLTSRNTPGEPDGMGKKVSILPAISKYGKYLKITIPLKKLFGGDLDEKEVWGFNLGVLAGKSSGKGSCRIFIDQIEFIK